MDDGIKDQMEVIKQMVDDRLQNSINRSDEISTIISNIAKLRGNSNNQIPSYVQAIIAFIILVMSIGGSWMGLEIKSAKMQEKIHQIEKHVVTSEKFHYDFNQARFEMEGRVKSIERDIRRMEDKLKYLTGEVDR